MEADKFDDLVLRFAIEWGVGKAEKNNGILVGISKGHKTIRISNGYGIEKVLTDEQTKDIITDFFILNFRKGDFYNGLGTTAVGEADQRCSGSIKRYNTSEG